MWFSRLFGRQKSVTMEESPLLGAVLASDHDAMAAAVRKGADLNEYGSHGMTPLLIAIFRGDLRAVELLLDAGADPNRAQYGDPAATPLWRAADDLGLTEIADALRRAGARLR